MNGTEEKKPYEAPEMTVHGSLEDLTLGNKNRPRLDANFSAGTPVVDITSS